MDSLRSPRQPPVLRSLLLVNLQVGVFQLQHGQVKRSDVDGSDATGPGAVVYGLGVLLYALLTGQPSRQGNNAESILAELEAGYAPIPPSAVRADVPARLDAIVMKCMESSVEARFGAAAEVAAALSK